MSNRNSSIGNLIFGPILLCVAILCLWANEGRFDHSEAARQTLAIPSPGQANANRTISYTGTPRESVIQGKYVTQFTGYYQVNGIAEIYSWKRREDSDGHVDWSKGWYVNLEHNNRNRGLTQQLEHVRLRAEQYQLDDLVIRPEQLHFVDSSVSVPLHTLQLSGLGKSLGLQPGQDCFYLRKSNTADPLGDERLRYAGVPTSETATYFGLVRDSVAEGKQFEYNHGFIARIIQDDGILHHLANGTRTAALETIESHFQKLKWTIRLLGTAAIILGLILFFSKFLHFIIAIPLLGNFVGGAVFLISLGLGLAISITTIVTGFLFHNPWTVVLLLLAVGGFVFYFIRSKNKAKTNAQRNLQPQQGSQTSVPDQARNGFLPMDQNERTRKVFCNLVKIAMTDGKLEKKENQFLADWGRGKGLSDQTIVELFDQAKRKTDEGLVATQFEDLHYLISLAMSDGYMSPRELHHIIIFGQKLGMNRSQVNAVISRVRKGEAQTSPVTGAP